MSTHQVLSVYCMPPSLLRTENISKLPPLVAQQLLQLARVAYESLCEKRYVFTDLGEDFEHLGTMKKTTSLNVCIGPGCSYSFLHFTLQEYLTALHIAIVNPSGFELVEWLMEEGSVVVRFLAGMCRYEDYHSHLVYQELVRQLASNCSYHPTSLQLVHCAYEYPSIMDSVKVDYSMERETICVEPRVGFDWYATGYCMSHFDERWKLDINDDNMGMEGIDLLIKGLMIRSSPTAKKRIHYLSLFLDSLSFSQVFVPLREFCELHYLTYIHYHDDYDHDDEVILQQLIAPGSGLRRLVYKGKIHANTLVPLLFQPSSLQELTLDVGYQENVHHELLPDENTNLKKLTITCNLLHPLAALIVNITSLTYLKIYSLPAADSDLPFLTNIVQSHCTLEVLEIGDGEGTMDLLQLIEIAGNSRLKKLRLFVSDYEELPLHIHEQYEHLLESIDAQENSIFHDT